MLRIFTPLLCLLCCLPPHFVRAQSCIASGPDLRSAIVQPRATVIVFGSIGRSYDKLLLYVGGANYTDFRESNFDTIYRFDPAEPAVLFELEPSKEFNVYGRFVCDGELSRWSDRINFTTLPAGPPPFDAPGFTAQTVNTLVGRFYGTTLNATPTPGAEPPVCGGAADDDVYLYVQRPFPANTVNIIPYGGTDQDLVIEVRDFDRSLIGCYDNAGAGETETFTLVSDRNALSNYQLRIYTKGEGGLADFLATSERLDTNYVSDGRDCVSARVRTLDGSAFGVQRFRDVVDSTGAIIASVENDRDAGDVSMSYYRHTGPLREVGGTRYANRNLSISVEREVSDLDMRIFFPRAEIKQMIEEGVIDSIQQLAVRAQIGADCSDAFTQRGYAVTVRGRGELFGVYYVDVQLNNFPTELFFHSAKEQLSVTTPTQRVAVGKGCVSAPEVDFDGRGLAGEFVDVADSSGALIVSIENTQPLGVVKVSYYGHDGPLRTTAATQSRYASRNVSAVPSVQPGAEIGVRLYLSNSEVDQLLAAGAINAAGELDVTKVPAAVCSATFPGGGAEVSFREAGRFGDGYYVEIGVTSFSEFFIHPASESLISSTSIADNHSLASPWGVAPNPVTDRLTLTAPAALEGTLVTAEVWDLTGRRLRQLPLPAGRLRYLNTTDWQRGMYLLVLSAGNERTSIRVVK